MTGSELHGSNKGDTLSGGKGNDLVSGHGGNDTIFGDQTASVTVDLKIAASLVNAKDANAVELTLSGLPKDAVLSAGVHNSDGTWTLSAKDLSGLKVTTSDSTNFDIAVIAKATDGSGLGASSVIHVTMTNGSDDMLYGAGAWDGVVRDHKASYADNDTIYGGAGNDSIWGNAGDDKLFGDTGNDTLYGGKGNDVLNGGSGDNAVYGNSGNDRIVAGGGNDKVFGGSGFDTIDFSNADGGVRVDLHNHTSSGYGHDWIEGVEAVIGSHHDDIIWGDKRGNVLTGNGGNDTFGFHSGDAKKGNVDHITDFNVGDKLDLSEMLHGRSGANALHVTDGKDGTTISVKIGGAFVDVVTLDGVHNMTAAEMLKAGMILV